MTIPGDYRRQPGRHLVPALHAHLVFATGGTAEVNLEKHSVRIRLGKGKKTTTRGFHPSATDALARWMDTRKGMGFRNGLLFCTHQGGPLSDLQG
jgi:site-specific recombinase XerC